MDKKGKLRLQLAIDQADTWTKRYHKAMNERSAVKVAAAAALKTLRSGIVEVELAGKTYAALPLGPNQLTALGNLARFVQLKPIADADQELLHQLDTEIPGAIRDAQRALTARQLDEATQDAVEFLGEYVPWGLTDGIPTALDRITPAHSAPQVNLANALAAENGLAIALSNYGIPQLVTAGDIRSRLATFTAAERFAELARSVTPAHDYVIVCAPEGADVKDFLTSLESK